MELSDTLEGKHPNQIKIDKTGRFVLPNGIYKLLKNVGGPSPFFLTEYDWENQEFHLRPPKNFDYEVEKLLVNKKDADDFCKKNYCTIMGTGNRINLAQVMNSPYYRSIQKVEGKNIKLSWKNGYIIAKLVLNETQRNSPVTQE